MRAKALKLCMGFIILGLFPVVEGCGGSDAPQPSRRRAKKKRSKQTVKRVMTEKKQLDMSKIPLRFRNTNWDAADSIASSIRGSRDPFLPYVDDLRVKAEQGKDKKVTKIKTAIGDAEVGDLKLIALITGTAVHKAMVEDNRGVGHIVRSGDVVGSKPPMRVVRITRNEVIFKALEEPVDDKTPSEVRKVLRTQEELQELLP